MASSRVFLLTLHVTWLTLFSFRAHTLSPVICSLVSDISLYVVDTVSASACTCFVLKKKEKKNMLLPACGCAL